ncbi:Glycine-rich RNA-binding protein 2, mitochondrial [Neofusicoccum ribis]|uniref:Glycine-rich RNA-binding protein 2, mitochondrial n=1 Tax=Neofusicoccum ribis TaxID=45134 RepID=A0ABR3SBC0_9PEZI
MVRVLLTGGSGFVATHILNVLLERGYSVVTTVRSIEKAAKIKQAHPSCGKDKLDFSIVEDISKEDAFDNAVKSNPPFDAVIHSASPFHYNVTDVQTQLIDPAVVGTTGILKSIKKGAPSVKRVVITSSFAAILDMPKGTRPGYQYSEKGWNPVTQEQALTGAGLGYTASKTFAERAAWEFVEKEKPGFTIATMNPPLVYGPLLHQVDSLDAVNTSNKRIRDFIIGPPGTEISETGLFIWVDVRALALAHVRALEVPEAAGKRFLVSPGYCTNRMMVDIIRKNFPEYQDRLPPADAPGGDFPAEGVFTIDNSRAKNILGVEFTSFEKCVVDTVKSLKALGA